MVNGVAKYVTYLVFLFICLFVLCLYISIQHNRLLSEQSQLKEEMEVMKRENGKLVREHNHLKQSCEELRRLHSEDQREVADMRLQQQQVLTLHTLQGQLRCASYTCVNEML